MTLWKNLYYLAQKMWSSDIYWFIAYTKEKTFLSSCPLQDMTHGVTKIKFDDGQDQKIVNAFLRSKYSHIIAYFYNRFCKATSYSIRKYYCGQFCIPSNHLALYSWSSNRSCYERICDSSGIYLPESIEYGKRKTKGAFFSYKVCKLVRKWSHYIAFE